MKKHRLRGQWLLYGSGLDWQLGAVTVFWLLFETVVAVVLAVTGEKTTVIVSGMVCLILLAFVSAFTGYQRASRVLTLGVALGGARRDLTLRCVAWQVGGTLISALLIFVLDGMSHLIYRLAYAPRGVQLELDGLALLPVWGWGMILLAPVLLGLCTAATVNRFGTKGYWVVWMLWMLLCFSPSQLTRLYETSPTALWGILAAGGTALLIWTVWSVRRLLCWSVRQL